MSLKILFLLVLCLHMCSVQAYMTFSSFQQTHNKTYQSKSESELREQVFNNNVAKIDEHNKKYQQGLESYEMGVNQFTDLSEEEFAARYKTWTINDTSMLNANTLDNSKLSTVDLPTSIDWRDSGIVTAVKDQGQCGGCWAFSATGTLEGQLALKYGSLVSLSEQQLLDCDTSNSGCNGGVVQYAINYVTRYGLNSEEEYPFRGSQGSCKNSENIVAQSQGYVNIARYDEDDLKRAVGTIGPVSVAVNIVPLQSYSNGIFQGTCSSELDHGVLAVGYGTSSAGLDYWIIKNSWGTSWGENGYYRLARGFGLCGIAMQACYPIGVTNGTKDDSTTTTTTTTTTTKSPNNSGTFLAQNANIFYVLGFLITVTRNLF